MEHIYELIRYTISGDGDYYRNCRIDENRLALCSSIESAEDIIRHDAWENPNPLFKVHSYLVRVVPPDTVVDDYSLDGEYAYDETGAPIGSWLGIQGEFFQSDFKGLDPQECRFKPGDICEVVWVDSKPQPAIVSKLPPDRETISRMIASGSYAEIGDNAYEVVMFDDRGRCFETSISTLRVFEPKGRIHPSTVRRLQRALSDLRTAPVREAIRRVTYEQRLHALLDDLGVELFIYPPEYFREGLVVLHFEVPDLPGYKREDSDGTPLDLPNQITISIPYWKIDKCPEMIRNGLLRLLGRPYTGKAFRLKEAEYLPPIDDPDTRDYYF